MFTNPIELISPMPLDDELQPDGLVDCTKGVINFGPTGPIVCDCSVGTM